MFNLNLNAAKKAKNDEFYTQYADIEKEIQAYIDYDKNVFRGKTVLLPCDNPEWSNFTKYFTQNFARLGLKKLISTCYVNSEKGKIFTLDSNQGVVTDLNGDGDFRSQEVTVLRDEADIIITNPPFSLFREFIAWIADKKFIIIGNKNAITYKGIFPLIKENKMWVGVTPMGTNMLFDLTPEYAQKIVAEKKSGSCYRMVDGVPKGLAQACWFTNLEHGIRREPLHLMTMEDNLKFNKGIINDSNSYQQYDNYKAIEVPKTNGIPSDYTGVMGVPISFLDKFNPEQFEILGTSDCGYIDDEFKIPHYKNHHKPFLNGNGVYKRIFIRRKTTYNLDDLQ